MANQNFVVHNGLTVGPLTIDAETGSIDTTGAISIGGNIGVSAIFKGDSSISIDDTGSGSFIATTLDGTVRQIQNATVATFTSNIMSSGNVTAPYYFGNGSQLIGVTSGSIFTGNVQGGLAQFAALNGTIIGNATAVSIQFTLKRHQHNTLIWPKFMNQMPHMKQVQLYTLVVKKKCHNVI